MSCPVRGQCKTNRKTGCPIDGPIDVSPPSFCVALPTWLPTIVTKEPGGGCVQNEYVQIEAPHGIADYEAVWYSTVGEGSRWWQSPGTRAPHSVAGEGASYRVPRGFAAWSAGGGAGDCPGTPPSGTYGTAGWGVLSPTVADACDDLMSNMLKELEDLEKDTIQNMHASVEFPAAGTVAFDGSGGSGSSIGPLIPYDPSGCNLAFDGGTGSGSAIAPIIPYNGDRAGRLLAAKTVVIAKKTFRIRHRGRYKLTIPITKAGRKLIGRLAAADRAYYQKHPYLAKPPFVHFTFKLTYKRH